MDLVVALTLTALGASAHGHSPPGFARASRVLLVDIDDVGYDLLQATPTPTLDWIAQHGRTFTSFTTSPICSPTRAMMMTGAYPSHPDLLLGSLVGSSTSWSMPLAPLEPLPRIVSAAGCTTAKIGKWHLSARSDRSHPNDAGWEHYAGAQGNTGPLGDYWNYAKVINGVESQSVGRYLTTDETDDAIACVRSGIDLVSLSYHAPHGPWHVPPAHLHSIAPILDDWDRARAMLQACDRELGRLVRAALQRSYTVLIASDNGTSADLGGGKGTVRDDGIIVPFWAIGVGVVPGVDETRIGAEDIYATVADLLDVPAGPPHRGPHSDSFAGALLGAPLEHRWTYSERFRGLGSDPRAGFHGWKRTVRGARYKLIYDVDGFKDSFYDLVADPMESVDLLAGGPLAPDATAALAAFRLVMRRL